MASLSNIAGSAQTGQACPSCGRRTLIIEAALAVDSTIKGKLKGKAEVEVEVEVDRDKSSVGVRCLDCGWSREGEV